MKTLTATEARQNFSAVISGLKDSPITISKQDKEVAVMLSAVRYQELKKLEDILYGKAAELAIQEGLVSNKEADDLLSSL